LCSWFQIGAAKIFAEALQTQQVALTEKLNKATQQQQQNNKATQADNNTDKQQSFF